ncbi:MAG: hypothetical protein WBL63_03290 [Candidatus Acidiferrum sp.]
MRTEFSVITGPRDAFPGGTHYEYDAKLKRTVEVESSGKRYPVALVAGSFQRGGGQTPLHAKQRDEDIF